MTVYIIVSILLIIGAHPCRGRALGALGDQRQKFTLPLP